MSISNLKGSNKSLEISGNSLDPVLDVVQDNGPVTAGEQKVISLKAKSDGAIAGNDYGPSAVFKIDSQTMTKDLGSLSYTRITDDNNAEMKLKLLVGNNIVDGIIINPTQLKLLVGSIPNGAIAGDVVALYINRVTGELSKGPPAPP